MALSMTKLSNKSIAAVEKQIKKYYASAMKHTIEDFESTYNKLLATIEAEQQPTPADLYKLDKYWQAQAQMRQELQKLGDKQISAMSKIFELNFFDIYYSINIEGAKAFNTIDKSMVQQIINAVWVADGKSWSERIWENTSKLAETLNERLIDCVVTGKKPTQLKRELQERFGVSYSQADSLARTEIAHIQAQAAEQRYKDYGIQMVEFYADPDERTCPECGKLHGKRTPVNNPQWHIPLHPRCRCCLLPVIDNE